MPVHTTNAVAKTHAIRLVLNMWEGRRQRVVVIGATCEITGAL